MLPNTMKKRFDDVTFLDYLVNMRELKYVELAMARSTFKEHKETKDPFNWSHYLDVMMTDLSNMACIVGEIATYDSLIKEIESERFVEEVE